MLDIIKRFFSPVDEKDDSIAKCNEILRADDVAGGDPNRKRNRKPA